LEKREITTVAVEIGGQGPVRCRKHQSAGEIAAPHLPELQKGGIDHPFDL